MSRGLHFASDLYLPAEVVTQKLAFLGTSGGGKTYGASKLAELMFGAGHQIVVLDPVGVWYGLRVGASGRGAGLEIPVMGGLHGDVPLEPGAGALVADTIVETGASAVLDVSMMRKEGRRAFATAFAEQLFHRKKGARAPLHLFIEEAQTFLPQMTGPEERRMLGAFEDVTKIGRNFGIGHSLISQRPQAVNKDALNQVGTLFVFRTIAKQERKAIESWIVEHGVEAAVAELPKLETGEAFLWSPAWLREFRKVRIGRKVTYDASATPAMGEATRAVKLGHMDLAKLELAMKDVVERAKADDPKALRAQVAELRRELAKKPVAAAAKPERVEVPVLDKRAAKALEAARTTFHTAVVASQAIIAQLAAIEARLSVVPPTPATMPQRQAAPAPRPVVPRVRAVTPATGNGQVAGLDKAQRAILTVLAQHPDGCDSRRLTMLAGYRWSGTFRNALGALRTAGYLEGQNVGIMRATDDGLAALGDFEPLPTGEYLRQYWLHHPSLGKAERDVLAALFDAPVGLTADELCERTGYAFSGTFRNALGALRTAGLLVGRNGETMRASEHLR